MTELAKQSVKTLTSRVGELEARLDQQRAEGLALDLTRGKPAGDQLDLSSSLDGVLARFKHPKRYVAADELPRNAMSKVQKAAMRADHADLFTS